LRDAGTGTEGVPLGRQGYGLDLGAPEWVGGRYESMEAGGHAVVIFDPQTGALLATEVLVLAPGQRTIASRNSYASIPLCQDPAKSPRASYICKQPIYYGPAYHGQVWQYTAYKSMAWTDDSPPQG